jgi:hypothetical protein
MLLKDTGGTEFAQAPVGTHVARCVRLIDLGTQKGEYKGQAIFKRQLIIGWELPTELIPDGEYAGKPFTVSRFYTQSLSEKANLRKDLVAWRGKEFSDQELSGFDAKNLLGKGCMLSIVMTEKGKAKVNSVMALPKAMRDSLPAQVNENVYFSLDEFNQLAFDSLSDGFKRMIAVSPEYIQIQQGDNQAHADDTDDSIPF